MKRILFVEDDPVVIAVYRNRLEREGFNIEVAEDGLVAMRSLATTKPDLVILDLMLPKVNGVEILKYIRGNTRLGAVPVVVLSNAYLPDMVKQAMLAGANKPLFKSQCTPATLLKVIRSFLPDSGGNGDDEAQAKGTAKLGTLGRGSTVSDQVDESVDLGMMLRARAEFLESAPAEMTHIRELCVAYIKNSSSPTGLTLLENLYQRVHFISARAGLIGLSRIAMLAGAFEAVLFEIVLRPASATKSLFHTIAQATDCLRRLIEHADTDSADALLDAKVLIVDDDGVCNHIMVQALRRVNLKAVGVKDPVDAIRLLQNDKFDLVLLDIMMPGMDGFEVCKQLRALSHQRTTPVIFVTANAEFENRVKSILSGGNELIAKPISPMELALKAITILLDSKVTQPETAQQTDVSEKVVSVEKTQRVPIGGLGVGVDVEPESIEQPEQPAQPVPVTSKDQAPLHEQVELSQHALENTQTEQVTSEAEPVEAQLTQQTEEPLSEKTGEVEFVTEYANLDEQVVPEEVITDEKAGAELMAHVVAPEPPKTAPVPTEQIGGVPAQEVSETEQVTEPVGNGAPAVIDRTTDGIEKPAESTEVPASLSEETAGAQMEEHLTSLDSEQAPETVAHEPYRESLAATSEDQVEKPLTKIERPQPSPTTFEEEPVSAESVLSESGVAEAGKPEVIEPVFEQPETLTEKAQGTEPVPVVTNEPGLLTPETVSLPEAVSKAETGEPKQEFEQVELSVPVQVEPFADQSKPIDFVQGQMPEVGLSPSESEESRLLEALIAEANLTINQEIKPMEKQQAQILDKIAIAVARIIFGEDKLTELNVRLVRIALERYNIHELLGVADK